MVEYTLLGTTYNTEASIDNCMNSLIKSLPSYNMNIVICDNCSKDNTVKKIMSYEKYFNNMSIIIKKTTRGMGRQTAFQQVNSNYIIGIDLDETYTPGFRNLFEWHNKNKPEYAIISGNSFYPTTAVKEVNGWRDLQWSEDIDFWIRLTLIGKAKWFGYHTNENIHQAHIVDKKSNLLRKARRRFHTVKSLLALHRVSLWDLAKNKPLNAPLYMLSKLDTWVRPIKGIIDVRDYPARDIITRNSIDLPIEGPRFNWFENGFILLKENNENK